MTIKSLLTSLGEPQAALAEPLGVTPQAVTNWLRAGTIPARHYVKIAALCTSRGLPPPPLELFGFTTIDNLEHRSHPLKSKSRPAKIASRHRPANNLSESKGGAVKRLDKGTTRRRRRKP